jgi:hypothetical protein
MASYHDNPQTRPSFGSSTAFESDDAAPYDELSSGVTPGPRHLFEEISRRDIVGLSRGARAAPALWRLMNCPGGPSSDLQVR